MAAEETTGGGGGKDQSPWRWVAGGDNSSLCIHEKHIAADLDLLGDCREGGRWRRVGWRKRAREVSGGEGG